MNRTKKSPRLKENNFGSRTNLQSAPSLNKRRPVRQLKSPVHALSPSSIGSEAPVTPEVAATVVHQYLLPLFESENRPRRSNLGNIPELKEDLKRPLEVVSNTVYGELKLADSLLAEYNQVKQELDDVTQQLNDTEQEKASVLSELEYLTKQYNQVTQEISDIQNDAQNHIREQQLSDLKMSFLSNQLTEYKKLYAMSEAENKQFASDLHEEKALNDKRRNTAAELEHGNELLRMENDIMAERLTGLYAEFDTLTHRRVLEDKLVLETDYLARSLEQLARFCDTLSGQLAEALTEREQLKSQHEEIEALTEEISSVRDKLLVYSRDAIANLQKELAAMVEQREEYKLNQAKLEKNYKDLAEAYEKLRSRLKQWKQRGRSFKEHEEKVCSRCRQAYSENENFNWSCKVHAGTYSANTDLWWCCGRKSTDAPGCLPSKHVSREEEEEEEEELGKAGNDDALGVYHVVCSSCKETGHKPHECPKDPNVRSQVDPVEDDERVTDIKKRKKLNVGNIEVNQKLMGILGAKFGDTAFGDPEASPDSNHDENFGDIYQFKEEASKLK